MAGLQGSAIALHQCPGAVSLLLAARLQPGHVQRATRRRVQQSLHSAWLGAWRRPLLTARSDQRVDFVGFGGE
jgi:hypothetical protein